MNEWLAAVILGLVEGLTEFIPVSSTGHLLLTERALGLTDPKWDTFTVVIQLGAILAIVAIYFQRLWSVVLQLPSSPQARRFALSVLLAFLPSAIVGLAIIDVIKNVFFESPRLICWSLVIGGVVLWLLDRWRPAPCHDDAMRYPLLTSLGIGVFQCLSLIPGVSRSGATILGATLMGGDRRSAAEFSFFLAIPTMVAATGLDLFKARHELNLDSAGLIAVGFVVSFLSGWVVVKTMLDFVAKRGFAPFAWWRVLVGGAGLLILQFG